uniref:von Willebrand factor A domain containing 5B1 n=1 Tax=Otus sunia TaxID=257818 RepID=A0A8C8B0B5_9STRI
GASVADAEESSLSPCSTPSSSAWERCALPEGCRCIEPKIWALHQILLSFGGFYKTLRPKIKASLHALQASLQLACGAFLMNSAFCDAVNIPMEKLKWTSPFACHRLALSPSTLKAEKELSPPAITIRRFSSPESTPASAEWQADSGRGSDTDGAEVQALLFDIKSQQQAEPEGMLWATAVALAWLEHSSASYFIEWELVAAKASLWLSEQDFPEGYSLATVKAAAQQLFVLLRHWDENLEFNLLCYNPSSV